MEHFNKEKMVVVMATLHSDGFEKIMMQVKTDALWRMWACLISYDEGVEMFWAIF